MPSYSDTTYILNSFNKKGYCFPIDLLSEENNFYYHKYIDSIKKIKKNSLKFEHKFKSHLVFKWVNDLTDCKLKNIDIATDTQAATDHKITVVPTILVLIDGEEEERYEADISFSMQATKKEVQEVIDEIVMDQF